MIIVSGDEEIRILQSRVGTAQKADYVPELYRFQLGRGYVKGDCRRGGGVESGAKCGVGAHKRGVGRQCGDIARTCSAPRTRGCAPASGGRRLQNDDGGGLEITRGQNRDASAAAASGGLGAGFE